MPSIPKFPVRDLKFEEIAKCALADWGIPAPKHPQLESVLTSYGANTSRVRHLMLLPTSIVGAATVTQRIYDLAEYEMTGRLTGDQQSLPADVQAKIQELGQQMLDSDNAELEKQRGGPEWDAYARDFHSKAAYALTGLLETPLGALGPLEIMPSALTGTWTAIETLLGDLWEAALNCYPNTLASLKGKENRIGGRNKDDQSYAGDDRNSKFVPLALIGMNGFDLRNCMGTVFRMQRRFEFTHLISIKEAYSSAFSVKASRIDAALGNKSLDCLNAVRNIFIHKNGIIDQEYMKRSAYLSIPKGAIGSPVLLDGQIVRTLIQGAISSTNSLAIAVDDWIALN